MKSATDIVSLPSGQLDFSDTPLIMGILNVTPDSFSDGGKFFDVDAAVDHALQMVDEGAAIIDVGPESTRPGAETVDASEQIKRAIPVIKRLTAQSRVPISIDTRIFQVAQAALGVGAAIINDITALADERTAGLAAECGVGVVLMHMQGRPETMQNEPCYENVVSEVLKYLASRAEYAQQNGISVEKIFIDPGIGFGKTFEHNLQLLRDIERFTNSPWRVLLGTSRKSFLGKLIGRDVPAERIFATAATVALAATAGVSIVRVHDVAAMADVIKVTNSLSKSQELL